MRLNKEYVEKQFGKIVIWGLKSTKSTFRYIFEAYEDIFKKLEIPYIWCDDSIINNQFIKKDNLVLGVDICCKQLSFQTDAYYCLMNCEINHAAKNGAKRWVNLRVFGESGSLQIGQILNNYTVYNKQDKILYQPWATNLLPNEFYSPVYNKDTKDIYWIGSIWNDKNNHGNLNEIAELKKCLIEYKMNFVHIMDVDTDKAIQYIRKARIAPAIGGKIQALRNILPCRMWKNISYGQMGFSNIPLFQQIFPNCIPSHTSIREAVNFSLSLNEKDYKEITRNQQEIVSSSHTYLNRFETLFMILEDLYK